MPHLTFAVCTYNRAERLPALIAAMRAQASPIPFEILVVNNNSTDHTASVLDALRGQPGVPLRWVHEPEQGIVPARNRALAEALDSDILVFIDDDELPAPGLLAAAVHAILAEGADCAGGRIRLDFGSRARPAWLSDELAGFLAQLDYGPEPFWIRDEGMPLWTANIAYAMELFRRDPQLRFDGRYSRRGHEAGGGEDEMMFRELLRRGARIRYRPDMVVEHGVEPWRLRRRYFFRLRYAAGVRYGRYRLPEYPRQILGVPPFLVGQCLRQAVRSGLMLAAGRPRALRQALNAAHALGTLVGYAKRKREPA